MSPRPTDNPPPPDRSASYRASGLVLWPGAAVPDVRRKQTMEELCRSAKGCYAAPAPTGSRRPTSDGQPSRHIRPGADVRGQPSQCASAFVRPHVWTQGILQWGSDRGIPHLWRSIWTRRKHGHVASSRRRSFQPTSKFRSDWKRVSSASGCLPSMMSSRTTMPS